MNFFSICSCRVSRWRYSSRVTFRSKGVACLATLLVLTGMEVLTAQEGVISRQEALAAVYQDATVTRDRVILTTEQMGAVAALARVGMQGKIDNLECIKKVRLKRNKAILTRGAVLGDPCRLR